MKMTVVLVKGTFNDIYGWGKGFYSQEKAMLWDEALKNIKSIPWKLFRDHNYSYDTHYLVSTNGSIYLSIVPSLSSNG